MRTMLIPLALLLAVPLRAQVPDSKSSAVGVSQVESAAMKSGIKTCHHQQIDRFSCENVDLLALMPMSEVSQEGYGINDLWGWEDPETGRRYVLLGRENGTTFVDITEPESPYVVGDLPIPFSANPSAWRDIKVYRDHAFVVADGAGAHGMQVFDLRQLRTYSGTPLTFAEHSRYEGFTTAHNVVINEDSGFAYGVGSRSNLCGRGLHMVDIREPLRPQFAGCLSDDRSSRGYTHDAQCVMYNGPDSQYRGREICFGSNERALAIADVTDKSRPRALGVATYPTSTYVHQGWLSEDQRFFYQNDEGDERARMIPTRTLIWDVADLDDPQLAAEFLTGTASIDHNLYVKGNLLFESNYTAGLQVLDIGRPEDPVVVGRFDTTPDDDGVNFNGAWSVYPWYSDGTVALSSRREGLFLLRPAGILVSTLESFQADSDGQRVSLAWTMRRQRAIETFQVDRLAPDSSWINLTSVAGGGDALDRTSYELATPELPSGKSRIRLVAVSETGGRKLLIEEDVFVVPGTHVAEAAYPNPASSSARFSLMVSQPQQVHVEVYDDLGRLVSRLHGGTLEPDRELVLHVDVSGWSPGRYWIRSSGVLFEDTQVLIVQR